MSQVPQGRHPLRFNWRRLRPTEFHRPAGLPRLWRRRRRIRRCGRKRRLTRHCNPPYGHIFCTTSSRVIFSVRIYTLNNRIFAGTGVTLTPKGVHLIVHTVAKLPLHLEYLRHWYLRYSGYNIFSTGKLQQTVRMRRRYPHSCNYPLGLRNMLLAVAKVRVRDWA